MATEPGRRRRSCRRYGPGAVARVKQEVAEMQLLADRDQPGTTIEPWDILDFAEKVRKAKYDSTKPSSSLFELTTWCRRPCGPAERRFGSPPGNYRHRACFSVLRAVVEVTDRGTGPIARCLSRQFRQSRQARGRVGVELQIAESLDRRRRCRSNNNNFVKGAPGEPVLISLNDAQTLFPSRSCAARHAAEYRYRSLATTRATSGVLTMNERLAPHPRGDSDSPHTVRQRHSRRRADASSAGR